MGLPTVGISAFKVLLPSSVMTNTAVRRVVIHNIVIISILMALLLVLLLILKLIIIRNCRGVVLSVLDVEVIRQPTEHMLS